jgi:hypothetical protein
LAKSLGSDVRLITISLDTFNDSPEVLKAYSETYVKDANESDAEMPEWVFACGDEQEVNTLRKEVGVYDLDPVIDSDLTQHAGILSFGNDRTNRWAAVPSTLKPSDIVEVVERIAGSRFRDPKYAVGDVEQSGTWRIQGPMVDVEPLSQTLSVMHMNMHIPKGLSVRGTENISGNNLADLLDMPRNHCVRALKPSSMQSPGTVVASGGVDAKGNLVAEACHIELASHLVGGMLQRDKDGNLTINGISVVVNPDLRFPMQIVDAAGNPIGGNQLRASSGYAATAEGYFYNGKLYTTLLNLSTTPPLEHNNSDVEIHIACGRGRSGELRALGTTTLTWVDSDLELLDSLTNKVLCTSRVRKRRGQNHGRFVVDCSNLEKLPRFVSARIVGESETARSKNVVVKGRQINALPRNGEFILEGPIEDMDVIAKTVRVNGVTVSIPDDLAIGGTNNINGSTLPLLSDREDAGTTRSLFASSCNSGFAARITGVVSGLDTGDPTDDRKNSTASYVASSFTIDAEDVEIAGILDDLDLSKGQLTIDGALVSFNRDERFGLSFADLNGHKIATAVVAEKLDMLLGQPVTVKGYANLYRATAVSTEYRPVQAEMCAVTIELGAEVGQAAATKPVPDELNSGSVQVSNRN